MYGSSDLKTANGNTWELYKIGYKPLTAYGTMFQIMLEDPSRTMSGMPKESTTKKTTINKSINWIVGPALKTHLPPPLWQNEFFLAS